MKKYLSRRNSFTKLNLNDRNLFLWFGLKIYLDPAFSQDLVWQVRLFLRLEFFKMKILALSLLYVGVIETNIFKKNNIQIS